jgi:hypothetical protein
MGPDKTRRTIGVEHVKSRFRRRRAGAEALDSRGSFGVMRVKDSGREVGSGRPIRVNRVIFWRDMRGRPIEGHSSRGRQGRGGRGIWSRHEGWRRPNDSAPDKNIEPSSLPNGCRRCLLYGHCSINGNAKRMSPRPFPILYAEYIKKMRFCQAYLGERTERLGEAQPQRKRGK